MKLFNTLLFSSSMLLQASSNLVLIPFDGLLIPVPTSSTVALVEGEVVLNQENLVSLVNNARTAGRFCGNTFYPSTTTIEWESKVEEATRIQSIDMYQNNFLDHTGSDGSSTGDRLTRVGYSWRTWGENVASGYTSEESVINGWLGSSGHCANIMNPSFTHMGVSRVGSYWTQVFTTPF